jgi:hypothetical protein
MTSTLGPTGGLQFLAMDVEPVILVDHGKAIQDFSSDRLRVLELEEGVFYLFRL